MDMPTNKEVRDLRFDQYHSHDHLANAARQAHQRKYNDFLIVGHYQRALDFDGKSASAGIRRGELSPVVVNAKVGKITRAAIWRTSFAIKIRNKC